MRITPPSLPEIDIGGGVRIAISDAGHWVVRARDSEYPLDEPIQYFRVWRILEQPFEDMDIALDRIVREANAATGFSYWKLIAAAFIAQSRQWTEHAMAWIPLLPESEQRMLEPFLIDAKDGKWMPQSTRHRLRRMIGGIRRQGQNQ